MDVVGPDDDAVGAGVNGIAEVGVAAVAAIPVLAVVNGTAETHAAGGVVAVGIGLSDREIESVRECHLDGLLGVEAGGKQHEERKQEGLRAGDRVSKDRHGCEVHPARRKAASLNGRPGSPGFKQGESG